MSFFRHCKCTHLRVHQKKIVNISSFTIANDNSLGNKFYYDRQYPKLFTVPGGWTFIVTDIIVYPSPVNEPIIDPNRYILAVVSFTNDGSRHFHASFKGNSTMHYPLGGAYVIPGGHTPEFRNTTFSTCHAESNLLGYFVKGDSLNSGQTLFTSIQELSEKFDEIVPLYQKTDKS